MISSHEEYAQNQRNVFFLTLQDGSRVLLRPVLSEDRERLKNGLALMSSESRYFRFFAYVSKLTDEQLQYFTEVDQKNHVAWIALDPSAQNLPGLGIARFIRLEEQPHLAEMALTVIDAHQQRGIGTILLGILYLMAQVNDIHVLRAMVLPENGRVCNWLNSLGAVGRYMEGVYQVDLPVHRDLSLLPQTPPGQRFKRLLENVREALYRQS